MSQAASPSKQTLCSIAREKRRQRLAYVSWLISWRKLPTWNGQISALHTWTGESPNALPVFPEASDLSWQTQLDIPWICLLKVGIGTLSRRTSLQLMVFSPVKWEMPHSFWSGIMGMFVAVWSSALTAICCSFELPNSSCRVSVYRNPFKIQFAYMFTLRLSKCTQKQSGTPMPHRSYIRRQHIRRWPMSSLGRFIL